MQQSIPLVKIASKKSDSGFLLINEPDFNPRIHTRYDEKAAEPSLTDLKGVAEATASKLAGAGAGDLARLIAADAAALAGRAGLREAQIKDWQAQAADLLDD